MENKIVMTDPETGLTVTVPESKVPTLQRSSEMSEEQKARLDRIFGRLTERIYGK